MKVLTLMSNQFVMLSFSWSVSLCTYLLTQILLLQLYSIHIYITDTYICVCVYYFILHGYLRFHLKYFDLDCPFIKAMPFSTNSTMVFIFVFSPLKSQSINLVEYIIQMSQSKKKKSALPFV